VRLILASARGLLGGWLIAVTVPLLIDPHTIAAWAAAGLGDRARLVLATVEILGAALFAFETQVVNGFALLMVSFIAAAILHVHHHEMPWWLAAYAVAGALLLRYSAVARRNSGPAPGGPARG
jgi:threonine/homoserine/homoserine lactone efflux protein